MGNGCRGGPCPQQSDGRDRNGASRDRGSTPGAHRRYMEEFNANDIYEYLWLLRCCDCLYAHLDLAAQDGESSLVDSALIMPKSKRPPLRDGERFQCPYPGCKRSFAELWRLKVHFRAPPDVRGSGKERGHGQELSHCPQCEAKLTPGKHHIQCAGARARNVPVRSRAGLPPLLARAWEASIKHTCGP
jgi:hypothetical protein